MNRAIAGKLLHFLVGITLVASGLCTVDTVCAQEVVEEEQPQADGAVIIDPGEVAPAPATKTWSGVTSSDFNTATNWSPNGIPADGEALAMPAVAVVGAFSLLIDEDLSAKSFASVTVPATCPLDFEIGTGGHLKVSGNITDSSSDHFIMSDGTLTVSGTLSGAGLSFRGGLVIFTGNGQSMPHRETFYNVEINTAAASTVTLVGTATITNNFTITKGIFDNGAAKTINVGGTFKITAGTYTCSTGTFIYTGASGANQSVLAQTYYNLSFNCTGRTATQAGAVTVNNDLTLTAGTFHLGSYTLYVKGDIFHNGGTLTPNGQQVRLTGAQNTEISGTGAAPTFYSLYVAKDTAAWIATLKSSFTTTTNIQINTGVLQAQGVTLNIGSSAGHGLLIEANGKFKTTSGSMIVNIVNGGNLSVSGTLECVTTSGNARFKSISGTYSFLADAASTVNLNGVRFDNTTADGVYLKTQNVTQLNNVQFYNGAAGGAALKIAANVLDLTCEDLYFDGTTTYNIHLEGNGTADGTTIVRAGNQSENGPGSGEDSDYDADSDDNGVPEDPNVNDALVLWMGIGTFSSTTGGIHATLNIIDFYNFNLVSTVVFEKDIDDMGTDGVHSIASDMTINSTFLIDAATYGNLYQLPAYRTLDEGQLNYDFDGDGALETNQNVIFFCTDVGRAGGFVFALTYDDLTDPMPLGFPAGGQWKTPLSSADNELLRADSGPIVDDDFCFVNATDDGMSSGLMAVALADKTITYWTPTSYEANVDPAFYYDGDNVSYLYNATISDGSQAYLYSILTKTGSLDKTYKTNKNFNMIGGISYSSNYVYGADAGGFIHKVTHSSFKPGANFPIQSYNGDAISMLIFVDWFNNTGFYGTLGGSVEGFNSNGSFIFEPVTVGGGKAITADLLVGFGNPNLIYVANDDGLFYIINGETGEILKTYTLPGGIVPTAIIYDFTTNRYSVGYSNGYFFTIPAAN